MNNPYACPPQAISMNGDMNHSEKSQEKLEEKLKETMNMWPNTLSGIEMALNLLTNVARKKITWTKS